MKWAGETAFFLIIVVVIAATIAAIAYAGYSLLGVVLFYTWCR